MNKKRLIVLFLLCIYLIGCNKSYNEKDTTVLSVEADDILYEISKVNDEETCVPTKLMIYKDGRYEIYTKYKKETNENDSLPPFYIYTKSNKGKYSYDCSQITLGLEEIGDIYDDINYIVTDYDIGKSYFIKHGETNKTLDELLKSIDVNLDICLEEDK